MPDWIDARVKPVITTALANAGIDANVLLTGHDSDKLILNYPAVKAGTGYSAPAVLLEFGARATGQPHSIQSVICDIAPKISGVHFPEAKPLVMSAERTFWESDGSPCFCIQGRLRGQRYSRHWFDLAAIGKTHHFDTACTDAGLAEGCCQTQVDIFIEKDAAGDKN